MDRVAGIKTIALLLVQMLLFFFICSCSRCTPKDTGTDVRQFSASNIDPVIASPTHEPLNPQKTEPCTSLPKTLLSKQEVADWVLSHFTGYYQKYNLSCEAALIRMITGFWGIDDLSEDDILLLMPSHQSDPDLGLVMENIKGDVYRADGSINWANYGAHPPVVKLTLEKILQAKGLSGCYKISQTMLDDKALINFLKAADDCLGAIIWVAAFIEGKKPPVNEKGQVLGEHVQFVSPVPDAKDRMLVYDVWPWEGQPFHLLVPYNRDMFDYVVLLIMRKSGST